MNNLDRWLKWEYDCDFGFPVLLGAAGEMYKIENGTDAFLSALRAATEEERRRYQKAIFETLYIIAGQDDKETLMSLFSICPWLTKCPADADLMSPLEHAVEHGSLRCIDGFLEAGMYDADEAMGASIDSNAEAVVYHLLNKGIRGENHLPNAIAAGKPIRNAVFEQVKRQRTKVSCGDALREALLENAETEFLKELADICTEAVFSFCFEDGCRLLDYAKTEEARSLLLEKGAKPGDPVVIRLLSMNESVCNVVNDTEKQDQLISLLLSTEQAQQALFDMCHRNGQYQKGDDLCYSVLKYGGFDLFERMLAALKSCKCIDGGIYCAPFSMWVKWTAEDWEAYRSIVRALLDGGVAIVENPILPMCRCINYEYAAALQKDTARVIEEVLELFFDHGVDINQSFSDSHCYNCLAGALFYGSAPVIGFLLKKGVKIVSSRDNPLSFLIFSVLSEKYGISGELMRALKAAGFDINETGKSGETVLHRLCRREKPSPRTIARAMAFGADPTIPDHDGIRPIEIAKEKGLDELCRILEGRNAV